MGARLRDHPVLLAVSAALPAFEATLIVAFGPASAAPLAPQVVAPAPYGVFHDLHWLLVYHWSWVAFAFLAVVMVAARAAIDATLVRAAWPRGLEPPARRDAVRHAAKFTGVQVLLLLPFAVLTFAMAVSSLSWLFFVAVPVLVMVAVLVHQGEVTPRWWRDRPLSATVLPTLGAFAALSVAGAAVVAVPRGLVPVAAALGGVAMAWCRLRIVGALARRAARLEHDPQPRRRPFALVGLAAVVVIVVGGTGIGFAVAVAVEAGRPSLPRASSGATGSPVLVVKGFNSKWEGVTRRWVRGDHQIRRFSYRGLDPQGAPLPYGRDATHRALPELAREMRRQVEAFRDATGSEVSIVAESEGALVAQTYLAATPGAPVDAVVLLSPLLAPGRVWYPLLGREGWGVASGTILGGLAAAIGAVGPVDISADAPLFRSIVDRGPALGALLACPAPGVRGYAVLPLDSRVAAPAPTDVGYPHEVVPAFHGGLLGDATTARHVQRVLTGRPAPAGSSSWQAIGDGIGALAASWQAPDLEPSLLDEWRGLPEAPSCAAVRRSMREWVDGSPDQAGDDRRSAMIADAVRRPE
ncbi:MAG TPA: hypothetical protein VMX12_05225 [Acidimicrobiia bacterium]|nr:hypothetical protein [Acidimicrobiia bacterium]